MASNPDPQPPDADRTKIEISGRAALAIAGGVLAAALIVLWWIAEQFNGRQYDAIFAWIGITLLVSALIAVIVQVASLFKIVSVEKPNLAARTANADDAKTIIESLTALLTGIGEIVKSVPVWFGLAVVGTALLVLSSFYSGYRITDGGLSSTPAPTATAAPSDDPTPTEEPAAIETGQ